MLFAHGFGCDQAMWNLLTPQFCKNYRIVTFDLVGSGGSDLTAYDREKYSSLHGYADDVLEIVEAVSDSPVIFVGHSVSAIIGLLASIKAPANFAAQVMVGPSPCYINDGNYAGGFARADIDDLLAMMESNYLGWSSTMAPVIMGAADQPALTQQLTNSFCRTDPDIAQHFARVTFLADHRADVSQSATPTLLLQCSDDVLAPMTVGTFMHRTMQNSTLQVIENVGHCPHLSAPTASSKAMLDFLVATLG